MGDNNIKCERCDYLSDHFYEWIFFNKNGMHTSYHARCESHKLDRAAFIKRIHQDEYLILSVHTE